MHCGVDILCRVYFGLFWRRLMRMEKGFWGMVKMGCILGVTKREDGGCLYLLENKEFKRHVNFLKTTFKIKVF